MSRETVKSFKLEGSKSSSSSLLLYHHVLLKVNENRRPKCLIHFKRRQTWKSQGFGKTDSVKQREVTVLKQVKNFWHFTRDTLIQQQLQRRCPYPKQRDIGLGREEIRLCASFQRSRQPSFNCPKFKRWIQHFRHWAVTHVTLFTLHGSSFTSSSPHFVSTDFPLISS